MRDSLWRPLVSSVEDAPLALCDRRTACPDDLLPCDKVHPRHINEGFYLKYRSTQRWYGLSKQSKHEPAMFLTWDSNADVLPGMPVVSKFAFRRFSLRLRSSTSTCCFSESWSKSWSTSEGKHRSEINDYQQELDHSINSGLLLPHAQYLRELIFGSIVVWCLNMFFFSISFWNGQIV